MQMMGFRDIQGEIQIPNEIRGSCSQDVAARGVVGEGIYPT